MYLSSASTSRRFLNESNRPPAFATSSSSRPSGARKYDKQNSQNRSGPDGVLKSSSIVRKPIQRARPPLSTTLLPTPKKNIIHTLEPNFRVSTKPRRKAVGIGIVGLSASSRHREVVKPVKPGLWVDKEGRLRNPDSESDSDSSMQSLSENGSDIEAFEHIKQSARKTSRPSLDPPSARIRGEKPVLISSDEDDSEKEDDDSRKEDDEEEDELDEDAYDSIPGTAPGSDVEFIGGNIGTESVPAAPLNMIQAILPFVYPRNLPFLRRNLRSAFKEPLSNDRSKIDAVVLQVQLRTGFDQNRANFTLASWICPLCNLLGELNSRLMLDRHLQIHHTGVEIQWRKEKSNQWHLILTFPKPTTSEVDAQVASDFLYASKKVMVAGPIKDELGMALDMLPVNAVPTAPPSISPSIIPNFASLSLTSSSLLLTTSASQERSAALTEDPQGGPRYPSPPPADNPLGPAARYPYLPATSDDGKITIKYSCRPGGPYLYDLLGLLPLDEFGVLSWAVLDRESEIFESDDISDEHKVMHALWGRWIFLNRKRFIQDYLAGIKNFIDTYWLMIHRAAGWRALRHWLLVLMVNKYLTASDVAQTLKHYEMKTDMKSWYPNY